MFRSYREYHKKVLNRLRLYFSFAMISLVIPAYNEEKRIAHSIKKVLSYMKKKKYDFELIVVNDGSKDKTEEKAKSIKDKHVRLISYSPNKGKGHAVKIGMLAAKGDLLLFLDADLSTPIEEIEKFIPLTKNYDVVIASRALKESQIKVHQPFYREIIGKVFNKMVQLLAVWGIKDTQCGFKMFTKKAANIIFKRQRIHGWAFDVELLFIAKKYRLKIKEMPVTWINEGDSRVSPIKSSIQMFIQIFKINLNNIRGYYN